MQHASPSAAGRLRLALFAGLAELAGTRSLEIPWDGGSVGDLRRAIVDARPAVAGLLDRSAVAIGGRCADDDVPVPAGADVAILPPVSGG